MKLRALREFFQKLTGRKNPDDYIYGTDIPIVPGKLDELAEARIMKEADDAVAKARAQGMFDTPEYAEYVKRSNKNIDKILEQYKTKTGPFERSGLRSILDPKTDADVMKLLKVAGPVAGIGAASMYDATEGFTEPYSLDNRMSLDPEQIGRAAARMGKSISEAVDEASGLVEQAAMPATLFFQEIQQGYQDELERQRNMEMYGQPTVPELESGAIEPVSLLFAEGGPAELGMDNEPRFAERPPFSQIFTIENDIQNKYNEYEMAVRNNELLRAQNLINEIDQLEQQKIMIQNQAGRTMSARDLLGERGRTLSNRDMEIANILESISQ
jgi:hypothetical protein|tara:strand:- start:790 stop:1773 length:984 start_codon:yes stop_codon:yes gene_type:complete